jgi:hypothetical protein
MEQPSSDDETEWLGPDAIFKIYCQEDRSFSQEGQPSSEDEAEWSGPDAVFEVYNQEYCNLSQDSLHSGMEEQCPPAVMPLESDDPVSERASEAPCRWEFLDEEQLVAIQRLMHYMVAKGCSRLAAEAATGISLGYEGLYRASPPAGLGADLSVNNHPIP